MRILGVAVIAMLLVAPASVPAFAQDSGAPHINMMPETASKTPEEKEREAAQQKAYKESLSKIPDAKGPSDPWGAVRNDAPKAAATRPAKPKTKTGSTAQQSQ